MSYRRPTQFPNPGTKVFQPTYNVWDHLYERLEWQYGPSRALEKIRGRDMESRLDELAWRQLGSGRRA